MGRGALLPLFVGAAPPAFLPAQQIGQPILSHSFPWISNPPVFAGARVPAEQQCSARLQPHLLHARRCHLVRPGVRRLVRPCRHSSYKRCSVWRWSCHLRRFTTKRMADSVLRSISPLPAIHWHTTSYRRHIAK